MPSILDVPIAYLGYQYVVGGIRARRRCIAEHVAFRPGLRVLDIGCGPGYVAKWLAGSEYIGLDTDANYIRYAQRRYGRYGSFSCALMTDVFLSGQQPFDYVIMTGLLHHLDDRQVTDVLRLSKSILKPDAALITLDGYYKERLHPIARFLLDRDRGKFVRTLPAYLDLAARVFPEVKPFEHPDYFHVPYPILVMECRVTGSNLDEKPLP